MADTLESELKDKKAKVELTKKKIEKLKEETGTHIPDITLLEKIVGEINQASKAYHQVLDNIKKDREEIRTFLKKRMPTIEASVKTKKGVIQKRINAVKAKIDKIKEEEEELKEGFQKAKTEYGKAREKLVDKQKDYDSAKVLRSEIEKSFKELKDLKELTEREEAKNKARSYFLIRELKTCYERTVSNIKTDKEYKDLLDQAGKDLKLAKETLIKTETRMKSVKDDLDKKQKELEALQSTRKSEILKRLTNI